MVLDSTGNVYLTGGPYLNLKLDSASGDLEWFVFKDTSAAVASGIGLENQRTIYVTGTWSNDFATIQYETNGSEQWVLRYNGPANGNDGATAIAVAPDGSIYVTGYSANEAGGTDIVLIKYAALPSIQKKSDGSILLQFVGTPGTNYTFQSATDLLHWTDLASALADSNGIFRFTDTNAPSFPHRFYRWRVP